MATTILIQNRMARICAPTYPVKPIRPPREGVKVPDAHEILMLKPGINQVLLDHWEKVKDSKMISRMVEMEELVELDDNPDTTSMSVTRAIPIVRHTMDAKLLMDWRKRETRRPVRKAIDEQLETLDGSQEDSDDVETAPPFQPANLSSRRSPVTDGVDVSQPRGLSTKRSTKKRPAK